MTPSGGDVIVEDELKEDELKDGEANEPAKNVRPATNEGHTVTDNPPHLIFYPLFL